MRATAAVIAAGAIVAAGCSADSRPAAIVPNPEVPQTGTSHSSLQPTQLALVDSTQLGDVFSLIVYRLQVKSGERTDTLSGIRVMDLPVVGADGNLNGIAYDQHGELNSGYRYDPSARKLSLLPLPPNSDLYATHMTMSPDARHIAYMLADTATYAATGVVRSWPDTKLVAQTPTSTPFESEMDNRRVRWLDASRAEFVYTRAEPVPPLKRPRETWIHAVVSADTHEIRVDTVDTEPVLKPIVTAAIDTATKVISDSATIRANQGISVRLVDRTETEEYPALKVEVKLAGRVDTIPGVLTLDTPVITPDGVLHGPNYTMDGEYAGIYSYDPRTRALSQIGLPTDAARWDSEVKLSPDAAHIAYIGGDSAGARGMVRSWPAAAIVLKTMQAPTPASDYSFNQVWWVNRDSVEFSWRVDLGPKTKPPEPRFVFVAVYASLAATRFAVDTLEGQPRLRNDGKR